MIVVPQNIISLNTVFVFDFMYLIVLDFFFFFLLKENILKIINDLIGKKYIKKKWRHLVNVQRE